MSASGRVQPIGFLTEALQNFRGVFLDDEQFVGLFDVFREMEQAP